MGKEEGRKVWGNNKGRDEGYEKGRQMGEPKRRRNSTPRSHLLPTEKKVSQPHDIAVVQLTHNLQLFGSLGGKGREPQ